jgi:hypothetical protein
MYCSMIDRRAPPQEMAKQDGHALRQNRLCGNLKKKPLWQPVHHCERGIKEDRDQFSAHPGPHLGKEADGLDRLDREAANHGRLPHRQDVARSPRSGREVPLTRRGRRHPPTRSPVARIRARTAAKATEPGRRELPPPISPRS